MTRINIEIVSDVLCPWCWVGKKNLDKAIQASGRPNEHFSITWKPFLLRPSMPEGGKVKAPDTPENPRVSERLYEAGQKVDINFTGKCDVAPNTVLAHTLLRYAAKEQQQKKNNVQHKLAEILFRMYFTDGQNVGNIQVLEDAAEEAGLEVKKAIEFINNKDEQALVFNEAVDNTRSGISGVPSFFMNGKLMLEGAQPVDHFLYAFHDSMSC